MVKSKKKDCNTLQINHKIIDLVFEQGNHADTLSNCPNTGIFVEVDSISLSVIISPFTSIS